MPLPQKNFAYSQYVSGDGTTYCMKADQAWIAAGHGAAACGAQPSYGRQTSRKRPRMFIYRDPTTFRTVTEPVFTQAAWDAGVVNTDTINVPVPGSATAVAYTLVKKVPEKIPSTSIGQSRPDHA